MKHAKKRKVSKKKLFKLLIKVFIIVGLFCFVFLLNIKHIEITGTSYITDNEILEITNLKNYPKMYKVPIFMIKNNIKKLPLVNDVKVSKSLLGNIKIDIKENKVLFLNRNNNLVILSNGNGIPNENRFLGVPSLLNYVPDDIYNELIVGFNKIDDNVLKMISEIEYNPSKSSNGEDLDNRRFKLRMNDTNTVYMNTINITQLNKYIEICSAILASQGDASYGILYLDSSTEENFSFESYQSIAKKEASKANETQPTN